MLSLVVMAIKIPVALALMDAWGLIGLPLSHAVTVTFEVVIMVWVLKRRIGGWSQGLMNQLGRILVAALMMGSVVFALDGLIPPMGAVRVLLLCAMGAGVFGLFAYVLQIRALAPLLVRIQRRMPTAPPGDHE